MNGIWLPIGALVLAIYIVVLFFCRGLVKNPETVIYKKLILVNLLYSLLAVCIYLFANKVGNLYFTGVLQSFYLIMMVLMLQLLLKYVIEINGFESKIKKKMTILFNMITSVIIILILALPIDTIITSEAVNLGGPAYYTAMFEVVLYVILIIFFNILFYIRNKNEKSKMLPFIILFVFFIIGILLHNYYPQEITETFIFTVCCLVMFHTIENPDTMLIKQLKLEKNQANKAKKVKDEYLLSLSHEIRTSLNTIVGFSECIKQEENIDSCYKDADDIIIASQNLMEIVNGIVNISKIETNKMKIVDTSYRPREMFYSLEKLIVKKIAEKPIELYVNISNNVPKVLLGDSEKLKQIIINILTHAVKCTERGYINLDVKCINSADTSKLIISIQDTGRGIKSEEMDKLFKRFDSLEEDKRISTEGTGLGLAIAKSFVEMMGGNINVQSQYGKGTKFTICLNQKIINDQKEVKKDIITIKPINLSNKKVLIVDDNKLNIKVCTKLLSTYNLDITSVESGLECIQLLKNGAIYDLILMDDLMPKMTGTETLIKLKNEFSNFNIPTVVLTANNIIEKREEYLNAGFIDCLGKPIEKDKLQSILAKYLELNNNEKTVKKEVESSSDLIDLTGKKILIVDDNNLNLKVAENFMKIYNPTIETINSGKECLERIKTQKYDLILLDDMMPELSGIETMKLIKKNKSFDTPIIVLTANAIDGAKDNYLTSGFDDYLAKPINREKLLDILKKYVINKEEKSNEKVVEESTHTKDFLIKNGIKVDDGLEYLKNMDT